MEVREKEMSFVSREKMTHLIRVPKSITDTNLHCIDNLTSKILVFTHTHTHTHIYRSSVIKIVSQSTWNRTSRRQRQSTKVHYYMITYKYYICIMLFSVLHSYIVELLLNSSGHILLINVLGTGVNTIDRLTASAIK